MSAKPMWRGRKDAKIVSGGALQLYLPTSFGLILFILIQLLLEIGRLRMELERERRQRINCEEQLKRYAYNKYVGKDQQVEGQCILEDYLQTEIEVSANGDTYQITIVQTRRTRKPRGQSLTTVLDGTLPVEEKHYYPDNVLCPECGGTLQDIGISEVRTSLIVIPAQIKLYKEYVHAAACKHCNDTSLSAHVVTANFPPVLLPGSFASSSFVSHMACMKLMMGIPVYRAEKYFNCQGISITRMTMNNWLLRYAQAAKPLIERYKYYALQEPVLHGDETPLSALKIRNENGQKKKCYIWLVRTDRWSEHPLVLFRFEEGRRGEYHQSFIRGFQGFFCSDGYAAYHTEIEGITPVGCLQHARAKFADAAKFGISNGNGSLAMEGLAFFQTIFVLEATFRDDPAPVRLEKRKKLVKPVMDDLYLWIHKNRSICPPNTLLGRAITYTINQWVYLTNIFLDGRLDISNNISEREIKMYVIARKNFLFVQNRKGGEATAIYSTLISTAMANNLNPELYMTWVFDRLAAIDTNDPEQLDTLLPWNAPGSCRLPIPPNKATQRDEMAMLHK